MRNPHMESFDFVDRAISYYEAIPRFHLCIMRSTLGVYCMHGCKQHQGCKFHVSIGHEY